jgi:hypothetical protein
VVWKNIYIVYKLKYSNCILRGNTKRLTARKLKELKTRTSNEDDSDKVALHYDDVLEKLKTTDGHTSRNVLKKQQSFIDGVGLTPTISILVDIKIVHVGISAPSFL